MNSKGQSGPARLLLLSVLFASAYPDRGTSGEPALDPCKLLSDEQVRVVVPKLAGGMVTHAGASLIKGVDAYECAYVDEQANGLNVILNIATDEARFAEIKGSPSRYEKAQKVGIGDEAWIYPRDNSLNVTAYKHFTVIDLQLSGPDATQKSKELIELARTVANNVE
jgi:hypothetical protein